MKRIVRRMYIYTYIKKNNTIVDKLCACEFSFNAFDATEYWFQAIGIFNENIQIYIYINVERMYVFVCVFINVTMPV